VRELRVGRQVLPHALSIQRPEARDRAGRLLRAAWRLWRLRLAYSVPHPARPQHPAPWAPGGTRAAWQLQDLTGSVTVLQFCRHAVHVRTTTFTCEELNKNVRAMQAGSGKRGCQSTAVSSIDPGHALKRGCASKWLP